ncbi:Imm1 family immunity protein [Streptomyces sp. NPDC003027]
MILAVHFRGETRYLRAAEEVSGSLDEILRPGQDGEAHVAATWLAFEREGDQAPVSFLDVGANLENGFGGAVWFAGGTEAKRIEDETGSDMGYYFWVSDTEEPPEFDPKVMSDPHVPSYFDPRGVLPLAKIRKVVEEFCQSQGSRPTEICWVAGNQDGTRLE